MSQRETKDEYIARLELMAGIRQPAPPTEREEPPADFVRAVRMIVGEAGMDEALGRMWTVGKAARRLWDAALRTHSPEEPVGRPEIVCLCGSTRFKDAYIEANKRLTLAGKIVLSVGMFGHADNEALTTEQKRRLDTLHLRKIDVADRVFVLNVDGYVGESTSREIEYANANGKPVDYLHPIGQPLDSLEAS